MADPNVALDPNAVPMRDLWGLDREGNQAAPAGPTTRGYAASARTSAAACWPTRSAACDRRRVADQYSTPPSKPPSEASKWGLDKFDDADDANERAPSLSAMPPIAYRNMATARCHILAASIRSRRETKLGTSISLYERYNELVTKVWPTLTKQEPGSASAPAVWRAMEMRGSQLSDLKQQNAEVRKRHEELLRVGDEKFDNFDCSVKRAPQRWAATSNSSSRKPRRGPSTVTRRDQE